MSKELYRETCQWLLAMGTNDAIFALLLLGAHMESDVSGEQYCQSLLESYFLDRVG